MASLTITKFNETNEETGQIVQSYTAIVINHKNERQQALSQFKNYVKELKIEVNSCGAIKSVLLFND